MISELIINAFLVTIMLAIGIALLKTRTVIFTVVLTSAYSLIAALMFITLDAVDVAFTEASVGAGISTILFLAAMAYLPKEEEENINSQILPALTCILLGGILIWCSYDLPEIGLLSSPVHQLTFLLEFLFFCLLVCVLFFNNTKTATPAVNTTIVSPKVS
jgi:multicomponent Na+:H+ antiporter subunit B